VKVGPIDGRAIAFFLIWFFHWRFWTLYLAIFGILLFVLAERKGYSVPNLFRRFSVMIMGKHRPALSDRRFDRCDK